MDAQHRQQNKGIPRRDDDTDAANAPPEASIAAPIRTIIVFAVIIGCFAVVYPRFLHPVYQYMVGGPSAKQVIEDRFLPPKFQQHPSQMNRPKESAMRHRPTHHPGARFTGAEQHLSESKGSLYFLLPIYTVGIIAFLLYTFYKVLSRSNQYNKPVTRAGNIRYNPSEQIFEADHLSTGKLFGEKSNRVGESKISEEQMKLLEVKLKETETQMNALIEQMERMKSFETLTKTEVDNLEITSNRQMEVSDGIVEGLMEELEVELKDAATGIPEHSEGETEDIVDFDDTENIDPEQVKWAKTKLLVTIISWKRSMIPFPYRALLVFVAPHSSIAMCGTCCLWYTRKSVIAFRKRPGVLLTLNGRSRAK